MKQRNARREEKKRQKAAAAAAVARLEPAKIVNEENVKPNSGESESLPIPVSPSVVNDAVDKV